MHPQPIEPNARRAVSIAPAGVAVLPFADVSDAVRRQTDALFCARRCRAAALSRGDADSVAAADAIAAHAVARVVDAVARLAHGDVVPVVVIAPGNTLEAATLQHARVSYVARADVRFYASRAGSPPLPFPVLREAIAYASGRFEPPTRRRAV